jgi:hypothetical protein
MCCALCRDAYVQMKVKEKGLDQSSVVRGNGATAPKAPTGKFNAFKEMAYLAKGGRGSVGGMSLGGGDNDKRKRQDDDGKGVEERKRKKIDVSLPFSPRMWSRGRRC